MSTLPTRWSSKQDDKKTILFASQTDFSALFAVW